VTTAAGAFAAGTAPCRARVLDTTHAEKGKPLLDILGIALRTIHPLISKDELLKLLAARSTGVLEDRHKTSFVHLLLPKLSDFLGCHSGLSGIFLCFMKDSRRPRIKCGVAGMTPLGDRACHIAPLLSMMLLKESLNLGIIYISSYSLYQGSICKYM
jgi:hypothetical protein